MASLNVRELGDYIREQRKTAQISLRQLARLAGVSNPYLSQIERGLRHPSAEILQQIAKALRISAEALYVQAGILEERPTDSEVPQAVLSDTTITERQKTVLLEIYESFRRENNEARAATAKARVEAESLSAVSAQTAASTAGGEPAPPASRTSPDTGSRANTASRPSTAAKAARAGTASKTARAGTASKPARAGRSSATRKSTGRRPATTRRTPDPGPTS